MENLIDIVYMIFANQCDYIKNHNICRDDKICWTRISSFVVVVTRKKRTMHDAGSVVVRGLRNRMTSCLKRRGNAKRLRGSTGVWARINSVPATR